MNEEVYDMVGNVIACHKPGKFKALRIAVKDGKVTVLAELTENRSLLTAHRVGRDDYERLATDLSRGKVVLTEPVQLRLKFE